MKKITLASVKDEGIGALSASAGVIGGSLVMKQAQTMFPSVPAWALPILAFALGYGVRLVSDNEMLKDVGTGLLIAGALDGTKKVLTQFSAQVPALATLNNSIPALSGPNDMAWNTSMYVPTSLRGGFADVPVVSSTLLR